MNIIIFSVGLVCYVIAMIYAYGPGIFNIFAWWQRFKIVRWQRAMVKLADQFQANYNAAGLYEEEGDEEDNDRTDE